MFNIGIGFEAVVEEMGVREAVNPAIERDAFEEEGGGFKVPLEAGIDGGGRLGISVIHLSGIALASGSGLRVVLGSGGSTSGENFLERGGFERGGFDGGRECLCLRLLLGRSERV